MCIVVAYSIMLEGGPPPCQRPPAASGRSSDGCGRTRPPGWMDGWMDGKDGWMDGWMDR